MPPQPANHRPAPGHSHGAQTSQEPRRRARCRSSPSWGHRRPSRATPHTQTAPPTGSLLPRGSARCPEFRPDPSNPPARGFPDRHTCEELQGQHKKKMSGVTKHIPFKHLVIVEPARGQLPGDRHASPGLRPAAASGLGLSNRLVKSTSDKLAFSQHLSSITRYFLRK